ncbi:MAG: hypothetical protein GX374_11165, partial [Bacilli bacterium]|nr:hypothetical protein [Bacilli bacterium]
MPCLPSLFPLALWNIAISSIEVIEEINDLMEKINEIETIAELMAFEGNTRELYYSCFDEII